MMLMVPASNASVPLTVVMRTWVSVSERDLFDVESEYKVLSERDDVQVASQALEVFSNTMVITPLKEVAAETEFAANSPDVLVLTPTSGAVVVLKTADV